MKKSFITKPGVILTLMKYWLSNKVKLHTTSAADANQPSIKYDTHQYTNISELKAIYW